MKKILILMARFGGGHEALAKAIADAIKQYGQSQYEITVEDGFPRLPGISEYYSTLIPIFKESYHITDSEASAKIINLTINLLSFRHLAKIIKKNNPDLIISNYPLINYAIKKVLNTLRKKIPFIVFFADATCLHHLWLTEKSADYYFAPTKECLQIALNSEISHEKLFYSGWILRKEFYRENHNNNYKKNLGFREDKKLIYLSGGGDGYGKIEEIIDGLLNKKFFRDNGQLVIVCGANHKLLIKLQKLQRKLPEHIFSFGFIQNVFDYKMASDVICSKAGPNDIFESILLEKPFFAHTFLWGHEEDNFNWVKKKGIGFAERDPQKMVQKIIYCLKNPQILEEKIKNVREIKKDHVDAPKVLVKKVEKIVDTI